MLVYVKYEDSTFTITTMIYDTFYKFDDLNSRWIEIDISENYVTPEQYGAGTGEYDTVAFQTALNNSAGKILLLKNTYKINGTLYVPEEVIIIGLKDSEVQNFTNTYLFDNNTRQDNGVHKSHFIGGRYVNMCQETDEDGVKKGIFMRHLHTSVMENVEVSGFAACIEHINNVSKVENCKFSTIYRRFTSGITDSMVCNNYINASKTTVDKSIMIHGTINNSSFEGNFVDYFGSCFRLQSGTRSGTIVGNTFDDCFSVFRDFVNQLTITGNSFTNIKYVRENWTAAQPPQEMQEATWAVFMFDQKTSTQQGNNSMVLKDVSFVGNLWRNCDHYIYCSKPPQSCINLNFRGNVLKNENSNLYNAVFKAINTTTQFNNSGLRSVYLDFLDGRTVDSLTNDSVLGNMTTVINSSLGASIYDGMSVVYNGETYINKVDSTGASHWTPIGNYLKDINGIPKTDLASAVQTSLGLADTALQSVPSEYITETELNAYHDSSKQNTSSLESDVKAFIDKTYILSLLTDAEGVDF